MYQFDDKYCDQCRSLLPSQSPLVSDTSKCAGCGEPITYCFICHRYHLLGRPCPKLTSAISPSVLPIQPLTPVRLDLNAIQQLRPQEAPPASLPPPAKDSGERSIFQLTGLMMLLIAVGFLILVLIKAGGA